MEGGCGGTWGRRAPPYRLWHSGCDMRHNQANKPMEHWTAGRNGKGGGGVQESPTGVCMISVSKTKVQGRGGKETHNDTVRYDAEEDE